MKIKVRKQIRIGTYDYQVKYIHNMKVDEGWRGCVNQRTGVLGIDPICEDNKDRSFLHEVAHMIDFNYECGLDEDNISRIAHGFLEFMKNNLGIEFDWGDISEVVDK